MKSLLLTLAVINVPLTEQILIEAPQPTAPVCIEFCEK